MATQQPNTADIVIHPAVFNHPDFMAVLDQIEDDCQGRIVIADTDMLEINRFDEFDPEPAA
jgi:hypothetical protein